MSPHRSRMAWGALGWFLFWGPALSALSLVVVLGGEWLLRILVGCVVVGAMGLIPVGTGGDGAFIGMRSVILDRAVVEPRAMVAAGAVVTPGKIVPSGQVWAGMPARYWREMREAEIAEAAWIAEADGGAPLELAIANAGVSAGTGGGVENAAQARRLLDTNIGGVVDTVLPAVELMRPRGHGQIAIMASLAAFRGFPGAPAYCASKAAVRIWGEALRGELYDAGIGVSVICPGYVRSAMTAANDFPMPLLMDADRAARIIRRGLARNRPRIAFP